MKSFLLLFLSLMTGCEVGSEYSKVKGCAGGWVEFTCKYPKQNGKYQTIDVVHPKKTTIRSTEEDKWEDKGRRVFLYHDTKNKKLRVAIKPLQQDDFGDYKCKFDKKSDSNSEEEENEVEVEIETDGCQKPLTQTAYRTAQTTITCEHPGNNKYTFFCRERSSVCEDILSTKPPLKSNKTFTLTETSGGFNVSISNVSSGDAAVYWCGRQKQSYRTTLRKIQLEVKDIKNFTKFPTVGQNFTYWCQYPEDSPKIKFICKGEDPSICQPLVTTETADTTSGRFSMKDDNEKRNITITVREVTLDDSGTYWCGGQSAEETRSNPFFHRFNMTVVLPASTPTPSIISTTACLPGAASCISSTQPTSEFGKSDGVSWLPAVIVAVCVAVLVLILVLVYKRFKRSENTRNGEAQNNREERAYEEIQERPQKPGSGTALKSIYVTANLPTNPSASNVYSTVNFENGSGEVNGDTYSTVQFPTYSTVNHPS